MKHRTWNHLRARLGGYFWLPCPLCGQYSGGHEWIGECNILVHTDPTSNIARFKGVCPDCEKKKRSQLVCM